MSFILPNSSVLPVDIYISEFRNFEISLYLSLNILLNLNAISSLCIADIDYCNAFVFEWLLMLNILASSGISFTLSIIVTLI